MPIDRWMDKEVVVHIYNEIFSSVQFSRSVVSDSLRPHESSMPGLPVHHQLPEFTQDSCPSSQWCHPAIASSVVPFSSCPQSLPASGSFPMSQLFTWGGHSTGVSALASFLPKNTHSFPMPQVSPLQVTIQTAPCSDFVLNFKKNINLKHHTLCLDQSECSMKVNYYYYSYFTEYVALYIFYFILSLLLMTITIMLCHYRIYLTQHMKVL